MTGAAAAAAYRMITRSDDDAANSLYPQVGGDGLLDWIEAHYSLPHLGTGPAIPGYWGLNHVHPSELAELLVRLREDRHVWPWLENAMRHAERIAADGADQWFGLRRVDTTAPVKQGWAFDWSLPGEPAQLNSTGYVDGGRYAVVVMVRGPHTAYFDPTAEMVTSVTRLALTGSLQGP